ncbi:MAG: hypothetical protein OQK76_06470 [Gammaproteobacteria bacterium]|nr:hypothetical protein [Gammaproteobacteria bacterium]
MIWSYIKTAIITTLVLFSCQIQGQNYDPLLLRAQASIFPRIILLDQKLSEKTPGKELIIDIITTNQSKHIADELKTSIREKYNDSMENNKLTVNIIEIEYLNEIPVATAYIVIEIPEPSFKKIVTHASNHNRIVFSYNYTDFKNNALISLLVKEKTYIYLNKPAIKLYNIKFLPVFYKIIKIIE